MSEHVQPVEKWVLFAGNIMVIVVYAVLVYILRRHYIKSKQDGLPNQFSLGYAIFFGAILQVNVLQILVFFIPSLGGLEGCRLSDLYGIAPSFLLTLKQLDSILYIFGMIILMLVLAAQVYPLEDTLGWKRRPATRFLIIIAIALGFVFIPALSYSWYTEVVFLSAVGGILLGLTLNIGINIKLATTTGILRKRSVIIIIASFLFYIGFILTLKVEEISVLHRLTGLPTEYDQFVGTLLMVISGIIYLRGLLPSFSGALTFFKSKHVCIVHRGEIHGSMYLCGTCNAFYCTPCKDAIVKVENKCWNCGDVLMKNLDADASMNIETVLMKIGTRVMALEKAGLLPPEVKRIIQEEIDAEKAAKQAIVTERDGRPSQVVVSSLELSSPDGTVVGKEPGVNQKVHPRVDQPKLE